jgi:peroxiredoxin
MNRSIFFLALMVTLSAEGRIAPQFHTELLGGGKISLKESLHSNRLTLLSFWATWCTPCLEELGAISKKMKTDPALPLDILAVNVDTSDTNADVRSTVSLYQFGFSVALDPKHEIFGKYHFEKTLPYSVLIAPNGEILATFNGYQEEMFNKIKQLATEKLQARPNDN